MKLSVPQTHPLTVPSSVPQLPLPACAVPLLFQRLAEAELWINAIWLEVNPDKAEAMLLGRDTVLKNWKTVPAPSIKRLLSFSLQVICEVMYLQT